MPPPSQATRSAIRVCGWLFCGLVTPRTPMLHTSPDTVTPTTNRQPMRTTVLDKTREILDAYDLTDEQAVRCIQSANIDSLNWEATADADDLPEPSEIHLDWSIDADLRDAGVTPERMQVLSFNIARQRAVTKAIEALAAF